MRRRQTLSVVTTVHTRAHITAAALELIRPVADEIVVAFDSRTPLTELGQLEGVADKLVGFEFTGPNRFRPWLREQASCDWLLLLDGDEFASQTLRNTIRDLIERMDVSAYQLPAWWMFPDLRQRLSSMPWGRDRHFRLMRNDGRLRFPGQKHTGAVCDVPFRYIDAAFVHLDLILNSHAEREKKAKLYSNQSYPLFAPDGREMNKAFYLPENDDTIKTTEIPLADSTAIAAILQRESVTSLLQSSPVIARGSDVESWWSGAGDFDYSAAIRIGEVERIALSNATLQFDVEIENLSRSVWHATGLSEGGAPIALSYHWKTDDGSVAVWDGIRTPLNSRILPGEKIKLAFSAETPPKLGRYRLVLDLVREGDRWFAAQVDDVEFEIKDNGFNTKPMDGDLIPLDAALAYRRELRGQDALLTAFLRRGERDRSAKAPAFSLDHRVIDYLVGYVQRHKLSRVLEFGSGVSTVALARAVAEFHGRMVSVEQDFNYLSETADLIAVAGVQPSVQLIHSGLTEMEYDGIRTQCYGFDAALSEIIVRLEPELIVIDGPSQASGASRLAVLPATARLLTRTVNFVLDDAFRDAELDIAVRWRELKGITIHGILPLGNGLLMGSWEETKHDSQR